LYSASLKAAYT